MKIVRVEFYVLNICLESRLYLLLEFYKVTKYIFQGTSLCECSVIKRKPYFQLTKIKYNWYQFSLILKLPETKIFFSSIKFLLSVSGCNFKIKSFNIWICSFLILHFKFCLVGFLVFDLIWLVELFKIDPSVIFRMTYS